MAGRFSRSKGQRGERAVIGALQPVVDRVYTEAGKEPPLLQRNTLQSHKGGFDVVGVEWLAIEVKNQETDHVDQWWAQTVAQAGGRTAVLFYKKNHVAWRVRIEVLMLLPQKEKRFYIKTPADIDMESFLRWFYFRLKYTLESK